MRINHLVHRSICASLLLFASGLLCAGHAQTNAALAPKAAPETTAAPVIVKPAAKKSQPVVNRSRLYCAGFIQYGPAPNNLQIVGGEEEQEQRVYSPGDFVYINAGAQQGVSVGQEYIAVRPRGQFRSKFTKKSGWLGVYTQELGMLRVVSVKERVSVALVTSACDTLLLGDLLRSAPQRVAPLAREESAFDRFAEPSGKQRGRIVLARESRETLSVDQIVYIDLGTEDNVSPGDYLTIYRPVGKGNITRFRDDEVALAASGGFESDIFKGGKFGNQIQRVENADGTSVYGPTVSTPEIKRKRPPMPRKLVGELVILSTQQRTATAIITRVAQEIHTGDYVEVQ